MLNFCKGIPVHCSCTFNACTRRNQTPNVANGCLVW